MTRFVLRRLAWAVPTLLGITLLTFAISRWAPGDPLQLDVENARAVGAVRVGAGASTISQYFTWLSKLLRFDLGRSLIDQRPVLEKIGEALPRTLAVSGLAVVVGWGLALPLGVWLARRPRSRVARALSALLVVSWSVPSFWVAVLALTCLANPRLLNWFPFQGLHAEERSARGALDSLWHLVLPVSCAALPILAVATRYVRAVLLETLAQPFVLAARARGLKELRVVWSHAARAGLAALLTAFGLYVPAAFGGSVVVERVFGIPGMGLLGFEAIGTRDYPTVMGVATAMAVVTLGSMLIVDVLVAAFDPRVRAGRST